MKVGDLVKALIGNNRREGTYGVDWRHEYGVICGELQYRFYKGPGTGSVDVLLPSGTITHFHETQLEEVA